MRKWDDTPWPPPRAGQAARTGEARPDSGERDAKPVRLLPFRLRSLKSRSRTGVPERPRGA